jgi:hypothetical protein
MLLHLIWRDGCALPQRLSRFPAAWSALTRRSLGDQGTPSVGNHSTSHRQCRFAAFKSLRSEAGASSYLNEASAHLIGDLHSHVTAPAFSRIEGNDAHRIFILPVE